MVHMPDDYPRLPQRRPSLRSVPSTERQVASPAPAALRPMAPVPEEGLLETLRKLWRRRWLIASWTLVMGLVAAVVAWSLPSYYVSEARVLVGVQSPRVLTSAEAILTDANPDAERVQNEGFILRCHKCNEVVFRMEREMHDGRTSDARSIPRIPHCEVDSRPVNRIEPR